MHAVGDIRTEANAVAVEGATGDGIEAVVVVDAAVVVVAAAAVAVAVAVAVVAAVAAAACEGQDLV